MFDRQRPALLRTAFWLSVTLVPVLAVAAYARARFGMPWAHLLGDPATALEAPFYIGFVSNVGILLWAAAASVFLFGALLLGRRGGDAGWRRFLLCSGLLAAWLGLDDLFLLHDVVFPELLSIPQPAVAGAHAALTLVYLACFAPLILRTDFLVLLLAFGLLAASLALDQLDAVRALVPIAAALWEDAAKLLGIGAWLSYSVATTAAALEPGGARASAAQANPIIGAMHTKPHLP